MLDEGRWPEHGNEAPLDWPRLRSLVRAQEPLLSAPRAASSLLCSVCHGPCGRRSARCYQCDLHLQCAPGSLADVVVPVAFAIKGGSHARCLWQYKSVRLTAETVGRAALTVRALLLVFLHDHGPCLWQAAGIPGPTHLAVVPTARGRPGALGLPKRVRDPGPPQPAGSPATSPQAVSAGEATQPAVNSTPEEIGALVASLQQGWLGGRQAPQPDDS